EDADVDARQAWVGFDLRDERRPACGRDKGRIERDELRRPRDDRFYRAKRFSVGEHRNRVIRSDALPKGGCVIGFRNDNDKRSIHRTGGPYARSGPANTGVLTAVSTAT